MEKNRGFKEFLPEQFKAYMQKMKESDYLLVDVRQPTEYSGGHLPGANLIPLTEIESRLFDLPDGKEIVFYCRSGNRSRAACVLAAESGILAGTIYNLTGGVMAWDGKMLPDFPKVEVFDKGKDLAEHLFKSMDLEKGAYRFYTHVLDRFGTELFARTIEHLAQAETDHARTIYRFWKESVTQPQPFEALFSELKGEVLEGGESLDKVLQRVEAIEKNVCLNLLEMALDIEYAAYDLYRAMAEQTESVDTERVFLSIAQAEKAHMKAIAKAISRCPEVGNAY
jgi:rhodanese-related sulfurtransferase/rubrerythrin